MSDYIKRALQRQNESRVSGFSEKLSRHPSRLPQYEIDREQRIGRKMAPIRDFCSELNAYKDEHAELSNRNIGFLFKITSPETIEFNFFPALIYQLEIRDVQGIPPYHVRGGHYGTDDYGNNVGPRQTPFWKHNSYDKPKEFQNADELLKFLSSEFVKGLEYRVKEHQQKISRHRRKILAGVVGGTALLVLFKSCAANAQTLPIEPEPIEITMQHNVGM